MDFGERRRSPRVLVRRPEQCSVSLTAPLKVLELSLTGALVATELPLPPGTQGQLRFAVRGAVCTAGVQVQRCEREPGKTARIGAMFTSIDEASRRHLEALLGNSGK